MEATTGAWKWDERSLYFNASWRGQYPVPTRPYSDWNYVTLKGRGVYVGDTLTIMNPVERWWGEGDEKIWVDGEVLSLDLRHGHGGLLRLFLGRR